MAQPASATPLTLAASPLGPVTAEPVPVAFIGRTSTLALQDPRASLRRQLRSAQGWLPPGWFIAAVYWDIESGGIDLEHRSQGDAYKQFTDAGLPRDGGMADLLREAAAPAPRIARIEAAQNSKILELEDVPANPDDPAGQAYRACIRARFAELHDERELIETQLKALAKTVPAAADTGLLDQLPLAGDVLPRLPPQLKARLFQTFDLAILWNKTGSQATVHAEITGSTLHAVQAILDPTQDGYHDTDPNPNADQDEPWGI